MKKVIILMCIFIPLLGFASHKPTELEKSIVSIIMLVMVLFFGALFKTFLVLRDREREKSSGNKCQYGGPIEGGGYDV